MASRDNVKEQVNNFFNRFSETLLERTGSWKEPGVPSIVVKIKSSPF